MSLFIPIIVLCINLVFLILSGVIFISLWLVNNTKSFDDEVNKGKIQCAKNAATIFGWMLLIVIVIGFFLYFKR